MKLKLGSKTLVEQAEREIESITPTEVDQRIQQDGVLLIDLRDVRELAREGKIPEAIHVPRGLLEFWIDPDCIYYKSFFDDAKEIIFYCNLDWRSALATQTIKRMGLENVSHMRGGFDRWVEDVGRVEPGKKPKSK
ncbi:MAG: rhodanese-like domain-containing protein [Gammaproteobacteria bacterium]|nr:rhodanese-like domain-containing protein [Gammaproteobacteria bacterium]